MKVGGYGIRMELGGQPSPTGGTKRIVIPPERRPDVTADGRTYEVVWFPHANTELDGPDVASEPPHLYPSTLAALGAVRVASRDRNARDRWSWLG